MLFLSHINPILVCFCCLFVCFWWLQEWFVLCVSIQYWLHPVTHLGEGLSFTCLIVHYWHLQMVRCSQVKVRPAKALWCLILLPHNPALFICDVTGMCCWAPNGRIHGHVFLNFRHQLSMQGMDMWIRECFFFIAFLSTRPAMPLLHH